MVPTKPPLDGIRVVELAGLAPAPFTGLILSDYGATVLRVDRPQGNSDNAPTADLLTRRKSSIALDLKSPGGVAVLKDILKRADVLIDPYRPGSIEGLGIYPEELLAANPRLIIARLTGFRRDGKYKDMAGHDINYLAVSGVLSHLGRKNEPPYAPGNILADFAGGGLMCAFGILMALYNRDSTGKGQVVENNMVDGAAYLSTFIRYGLKTPMWNQPRGENLLDGGCPYYDVYECSDGGYMAVGALEPQFFHELVSRLDLADQYNLENRLDRSIWPTMKQMFQQRFLQKTRREWEEVFDGSDACCTPVLEQHELYMTGYEHKPAVSLAQTPGLAISHQQEAWEGRGLAPGDGAEKLLRDWLNWRDGKDYQRKNGGLVKIDAPKL